MSEITSILEDYDNTQNRRARGGINALAGFDYQLRYYLADLVESLTIKKAALNHQGQLFLEALSDLAVMDEIDKLVCIQVKRTLTTETLKHAAIEIVAINDFLAVHYPKWHSTVKFKLVASKSSSLIEWSKIPSTHSTYPTIQQLLSHNRLLQPRIEPDPWWRAIVAAWQHLDKPYEFLRFALDRALTRAAYVEDAQRIRDDICERFTQSRRDVELPGQLLISSDFQVKDRFSPNLEVGKEITLARMRDGQYMSRNTRLEELYQRVILEKYESLNDLKSEAKVFWLSGRSGVGKSVLLLQTVKRLVDDGWRVLWLKGQADLLEPALRIIADAPSQWRPDFIAIDDLYDRDSRDRLDLSRIGEFIDEQGQQAWPMILTCGPTEFAESFAEAAKYRGFELIYDAVEAITTHEAVEIEAWYNERTGKKAKRGTAFSQATQEGNGLFISLAVELAHGDLRAFARRFSERICLNGLEEALRLPLALNRIYLRAPYHWLDKKDREKLETLNSDGDFSLLEPGEEGKILRLTHPHMANALYIALREPRNSKSYTHDLISIFNKALDDQYYSLVAQLLRIFSGRERGVVEERLNISDNSLLANECARIWLGQQDCISIDVDFLADITTSWACWAASVPEINEIFSSNLLAVALGALRNSNKVWTVCWRHLEHHFPCHKDLFEWAVQYLTDEKKIKHPTWSFVWEICLDKNNMNYDHWCNSGFIWLQQHFYRPDWHFVWKKLLPENEEIDWDNNTWLILGLKRLHNNAEGSNWAFVFQDLYSLATPESSISIELEKLAKIWLINNQDTKEWAHVWRALLNQDDHLSRILPINDIIQLGLKWLNGREEKIEWTFVLRALIDNRNNLIENSELRLLVQAGCNWLNSHGHRAEWRYFWKELLEFCDYVPFALESRKLILMGNEWLKGHEAKIGWIPTWRILLARENSLSSPLELKLLMQMGAEWLKNHLDKDDWGIIWQIMVEKKEDLPPELTLKELLHLGEVWLFDNRENEQWIYVWRSLIEEYKKINEQPFLKNMLNLGCEWLKVQEGNAKWSFVCEALLEYHFNDNHFLLLASQWLMQFKEKPEWALLAAKFIIVSPLHPISINLAIILTKRIEAYPNNKKWEKMSSLPKASINIDEAPQEIKKWLKFLEERHKLPVWEKAKSLFAVTQPVEGLVSSVKARSYVVELSIGLLAICYDDAKFASELIGKKFDFFIVNIMPHKGRVIVSKSRPTILEMNVKYQGLVKKQMSYGLFIDINGTNALLHKNNCSNFKEVLEKFPLGSLIYVEVALFTDKGVELKYAGDEISFEVKEISVGSVHTGLVSGMQNYGLFVQIYDSVGLLHKRMLNINANIYKEYFIGQSISVEVMSIASCGRITLGLPINFEVGATIPGCIIGLQKYGVFLKVGNRSGLLHYSLLGNKVNIFENYKVGQIMEVKVLKIHSAGKIDLGLP